MQVDSRMALEPAIFFRLVRIQVVHHDMQITVRIGGHDLVHEIQKLPPPPSVVMARDHLSGSDVEGSKQSGGAVPLVAVATSIQRLAIGETKPPLRTLQGL